MTALDYLADIAPGFSAKEVDRTGESSRFEVEVALASGVRVVYVLRVDAISNSRVTVKEDKVSRLPKCCPDRHINPGGTFCLSWDAVEPLRIDSQTAAEKWWDFLTRFLRCQEAASALRKWACPGYAHGDAASYQRDAEQAAARLGSSATSLLDEARLSTRRRENHGRARIELLRDGIVLARVHSKTGQIINPNALCICGERSPAVPLSECGDHAAAVGRLAVSLQAWRTADFKFVNQLRDAGIKCCKTLDSCSLV